VNNAIQRYKYEIIRLICIERYKGFKYRRFSYSWDQGRMDSEFREEQMFREDREAQSLGGGGGV